MRVLECEGVEVIFPTGGIASQSVRPYVILSGQAQSTAVPKCVRSRESSQEFQGTRMRRRTTTSTNSGFVLKKKKKGSPDTAARIMKPIEMLSQ